MIPKDGGESRSLLPLHYEKLLHGKHNYSIERLKIYYAVVSTNRYAHDEPIGY